MYLYREGDRCRYLLLKCGLVLSFFPSPEPFMLCIYLFNSRLILVSVVGLTLASPSVGPVCAGLHCCPPGEGTALAGDAASWKSEKLCVTDS